MAHGAKNVDGGLRECVMEGGRGRWKFVEKKALRKGLLEKEGI